MQTSPLPHASPIPDDASAPEEVLHKAKWLTLKRRGRWEYAGSGQRQAEANAAGQRCAECW